MVSIPRATGKRTSARRGSSVKSSTAEVEPVEHVEDIKRVSSKHVAAMIIPDPGSNNGTASNPRPRLRKSGSATRADSATEPRKRIKSTGVRSSGQSKPQRESGDLVNVCERLELENLSTAELHEVMDFVITEIKARRVHDRDLDAIMEQGFAECFNAKGVATIPQCINGIVVIPGSVEVKNQRGDHDCNLYTVRIGDEDRWSWDFHEHILESKTFTDGKLRKTVTLYPAFDGMLIFGHDRKKGNKKDSQWPVHTYKQGGVNPLKLVMDDDLNGRFVIAPVSETRSLPLPSGIEDTDG